MIASLCELTKIYPDGKEALHGVSLEIDNGVLGIIGPNGAGKTTLLRILATLMEPSGGSVTLFGEAPDKASLHSIRRRLGYVPQYVQVVEDLTVRENLEFFYDSRRISAASKRRWIDMHIDLIGLSHRSGIPAKRLSGGERRKLGFALGIIHRPGLLICDEITTGLDPGERVFFRNLIAEIGEKTAVVFSTHIIEDISSAADVLCMLSDGELLFCGKPLELIESCRSKTWEIAVPPERSEEIENAYMVLERRRDNGCVRLRLITSDPPPGAFPATCRVEDAFLSMLSAEKKREFLVD